MFDTKYKKKNTCSRVNIAPAVVKALVIFFQLLLINQQEVA